jgi:hypothetical protein
MPEQPEAKKPWELDPVERGLRDASDIIQRIEQVAYCSLRCRDLGKSAYFCAAELTMPTPHTRVMLMTTCRQAKEAGGTQPRHGIKSTTSTT